MGFGLQLHGYMQVLETLKDLKFRFDGQTVYVVGTNVKYGVFQEFGTKNMPAQPYMRPAVKEVSNNLVSIVGDAGSEEQMIKRIAFAIEKEAKLRAPVDTGNLKGSIEARKVK